jgi:signal transduction histidine kinase
MKAKGRQLHDASERRVRGRTAELRASEERYRRLAQEREQQLILSDRRVSFGELAASLAHEFNNPLGIILGFAQDLLKDVRPTDSLYRRLKIIEAETQRCKQLMQRLRQFARPTPIQLSWVNLAEVISQSLEFVASECRKLKVKTAVKVDPSLPRHYADPQQLQQVLLNLYFNALEAMPEGGTLSVRATLHTDTATTAETPWIRLHRSSFTFTLCTTLIWLRPVEQGCVCTRRGEHRPSSLCPTNSPLSLLTLWPTTMRAEGSPRRGRGVLR